jgi:VWFA-related protein
VLLRQRWLVCLILPSFLVSALQSQTPAPNANDLGTTLKSKTNLVVVDVVVTDRNDEPVAGLHKEDFQVLEDGKTQSISVFEEHTGAAPVAAKPPALPPHAFTNLPRADVPDTLNVLLLDALNTQIQDQSNVHHQMIKYLAGVHPGTRLAIFTMSLKLRLVQGFTSDPALLLAALNDKKSGGSSQASPLLRSPAEANADEQGVSQMKALLQSLPFPDPTLQASIDALTQFQAETTSNQTDSRIQTTLFEMQQLATYLSGFPGRKNVIWFSGGFPLNIFQDISLPDPDAVQRQYEEEVRRTADQLTKAQVAVYPVEAGGLVYSLYDASSIPRNVYADAKHATQDQITDFQNDTTQRNANHATMDDLAKDTGGEAFYNTNGIDDALTRAMHNGARYYTLDYSPANKNMDGRYRHIQVKLKHGRYTLAYRRGYNAEDEKTVTAANQKQAGDPLQPLMAPGMPNFAQIIYLMSVLPLDPQPDAKAARAGDNAKFDGPFTRIGVDFAIHVKDLKLDATPDGIRHGNLEFTLIAYDHYGNPLNWMVRATDFTLSPERYAEFMKVGLQLHFDIDAPRSAAYLRTGIYDVASGKFGTLEVPLNAEVAAAPAAATSLSGASAAKPN